MIQETSISIYRQIKESGVLSELRFHVYDAIYRANRPITQAEVLTEYFPRGDLTFCSVNPRFSELERMGVIESRGTRICKVSGNNKMTYVVTGRYPTKLPAKKSRNQQMKQVHSMLIKLNQAISNPDVTPIELNASVNKIIETLKTLIK